MVKKGDVIGLVGSTGKSTGNHLHFEIRQGTKPIDPIAFLKNQKE
jgi:murein DD-endopeptidase MepM/ murein hydrolase activator NlpD